MRKPRVFYILGGLVLEIYLLIRSGFHPIDRRRHHLINNFKGNLSNIEDVPHPPEKSIFFHETSLCSIFGNAIELTPRQACAIESAAYMNPEHTVYVLFNSPVQFDSRYNITKALLKYNNVRFHQVYLPSYAAQSPLHTLVSSGKLSRSLFLVSHTSDVLRYLTLWRYGGIYLDLDVIVVKPLSDLPGSWTGRESPQEISAGAMSLDHTKTGRLFAKKAVDELARSFSGTAWSNNGPGVLQRVVKATCPKNWPPHNCSGLLVFPEEILYPMPYRKWKWYFESQNDTDHTLIVKMEKTFVHHTWGKVSSDHPPPPASSPYVRLAAKFCPLIYNVTSGNFWTKTLFKSFEC